MRSRVDRLHSGARDLDLELAHVGRRRSKQSVQIGPIDDVVIDQKQPADPEMGQLLRDD